MTAAEGVASRRLAARPLFVATIFLGSFLLFFIQPMLGRMALPTLGGAPAVWNVAMLFYQAMLLAGYVYAHAISRLAQRRQTIAHLAVFAVAALTLPISLADIGGRETVPPMLWLLALLAASIGPVFFVVAAQAPLMQSWYARVDDPAAADPYFLYAASNAGSLLALLAYPFAVEPYLRLKEQAWLWSGGFVVLALLVAVCARRPAHDPVPAAEAAPSATWRERAVWTALAAVPSGLLLSTTTHLTTDIVAVPLLWVVPLALYLVTFIVAFSMGGAIFVKQAKMAAPILLLLLGGYTFLAQGVFALLMALTNLVLLFVVALALHGHLAERRPPPSQLTDFYLWISVGGVLGGLFSAIVAPLVFDWVYEHPILLVCAAALIPAKPLTKRLGKLWKGRRGLILAIALPLAALAASWWVHTELILADSAETAAPALALIALAAVLSIGRRLTFAACFGALMLGLGGWQAIAISRIELARERSFFGIYTVKADSARLIRQLEHGTTLHGVQSLIPDLQSEPQSYYAKGSGVAEAFEALPKIAGRFAKVGYVGLGTGSLSCFATPGQGWTAFEIDPLVVRLAKDERLFTYIARCTPDLRIVMGDARLSLAKEPKHTYDLIAIDAFTSDAIPMHLMTEEAFRVYAGALKPDGVLMVHISNRHIDLQPVIAAIAADMGWTARVRDHTPYDPGLPGIDYSRSIWVALTPTETRMQDLMYGSRAGPAGWALLREKRGLQPWTDDFASIIPVLKQQ